MRGVLSRGVAVLPLAAAGSGHAFAQSLEAAGTVIIPDGRTATSLSVDGATTDVTTGTMAGGNAYNSFSRFEVGGSSTVNLHVPVDAGHLINIVRDAPVVVDGTLNAMRDGRIGGNVVFADPYGFIVNKNGVVNAGSLTVVTPTRDFLEQTIDGAGRIDTALGARIIDGDVPISPDGSIVIRGKVNTETGVFLKGNTVTVDGPARHKAQFEATVNTKGRRSGGQIVVHNGKLRIVAAGAARVGGKLKAGGQSSGGVIEIGAAEISVLPTARIEALRANDADALVAASEAVRRGSAGKVSITAAGNLSVAGSIRAEGSSHAGGAIVLAGGGVDISARADIAATIAPVPTSREAALAGPSVSIRSTGDLSVAGKVSADGAAGRSGGNIDVLAARDIALAATAQLSANGAGENADGGRIIVFADRNLSVADGFTVKAAAGATGDGGFVELSAKKVVDIATINLDVTAAGGSAGTLLIDPEDIVIGGSGTGTVVVGSTTSTPATYVTSQITNGANIRLEATDSITIKSNYGIDTRVQSGGVTTANSGSVTLKAGSIAIETGGYIRTSVTGASTYAAGNVTLEAQTITVANGAEIDAGGGTAPARAGDVMLTAKRESTGDHWGEDGKTDKFATSITVNGTVTGKTVTLESYARYEVGSLHAGTSSTVSINGTITGTAINVLSKSEARSNYNDSGIEFGILEGVISALNPLGLDAAWISSSAKAHLNVGSNANITGGTVKLESLAIGESVDQAVGLNPSGSAHLSIGVIVGMVDTDARTNVAQGARITTTESLGVSAVTDTRLNVLSSVISGVPFVGGMLGGAPVVGAVAYGSADVDAYATIQANATIGGTGSVTVLARSDNMFSVNAKVYGAGNAKAGGALAISEVNSSTIARLGSSVDNTAAATPRDVMVQAISNVKTHDTSASTTVGDGVVGTILAGLSATGNLIGGATPDIEGVSTLIFDKFIRSPAGGASNTPAVKGAASLSLATGSITADASIARDPTGGLVPVIRTNGNISVVSDVASKKIVSTSSAGVNPGGVQPTQAGMAVGVAVFEVGHYSRAYLGAGAQAHGRNVGINAFTNIPVGIFLQNWDNALQVIGDAFFAILANPGLITSGAKATTESSGASLAGSYNHFKLGVDTVAWLAQGAQISSTGNGERWQIEKLDAIGKPETDGVPSYDDDDNLTNRVLYSFGAAVDIAAATEVESLNVAGNWGLGAGNAGGSAVGGSAGNVFFDIATVAGVADSASITAAADVDVDATSRNFTLVISPSNGSGSSIAGSGLVGYARFDGRTHATISSAADVTANTVNIRAEDKQNIYAGAGQVQRGGGTSIGLSVAIVDANTDTAAYVGNNVGAGGSAVDAQTAATSRQGRITVDDLTVRAWTRGEVVVASVAAVSSDPAPKTPPPGTPSKALEMLMGSQTTSAPSFSLTISGSSSVLINDLDTGAYLDRADVRRRTGTAASTVSVEAVNTVNSYSISGSGAVAVGGPSSVGSAGVAGALALGGSDNSTVAYIANSNLDDITNVAVQALAGGGYTVAAVGLSLSADSNSLLSVAGSVSIALIEDSVRASVDGSTLDGTSGGSVAVTAYRKTEISIGGGSMGVGGKVGAGLALTYTKIRDGEDGPAALARVSGSTIEQYIDLSAIAAAPSRIYSGAAATAFGANSNSLAGAIIANDIGGSIVAAIEGDSDDEIDVSRHVNVKSGTADAGDLNAKLAAATDRTNRAANNYSAVTYENAENGAVTEIAAGAAIVSMAGSVAAGQNSIGATIISNDVHQSHVARIAGTTVEAGENVTVAATDTTSILGLGIGLGVATGAFAGQAGVVTNRVNSSIAAEIGTGAEVTAGNVAVTAQDAVVVRGSVVSAAISSGIGASAAVAVNHIAMDVGATVTGATIETTGSVDVTARSTADILTVAAGVSIGSSGGLAGSAASSKIDTNVRALVLSGSDIDAGNDIIVDARNTGRISVVAGSVGVGAAGAGIGLSVTVNEIGGETEARIADSEVDANGGGADRQVQAGALATALTPGDAAAATPTSGVGFATPDFTQQTRSVSGVAVLASSTQTVSGVAVTVGLAGAGPAAAIMPVITIAGGRTVAAIDRSTVGTELDTSSDVLVSASSHSFSGNLGIGGAASASATAGAAVSVTTTMKRSTDARILDSTVGQSGALTVRPAKVTVEAAASQSASDIAVGVAAGLMAGAGGSAIVTVFNADTEASIEGGQLHAGSSKVSADSTNGYFAAAGAAAGGLFGGKSGAAVVGVSKNTTVARVGRTGKTTGVSLNGDLDVLANSRNVFTSHAYGFAGGVIGAPIAGQALVTVVANDTQAILRDATITIANDATVPTGESTTRPAGVTVAAFEGVQTKVATGGGALALFGVGTGAAANVVVLTSKVQADSSGGSINLPGIFDISATTDKVIDAKTITAGGGLAGGIGAAVGVIIAGGATAGDAMAELNKGGEGTLASLNRVSAAGEDFVLAQAEIAGWRSRVGVSNPTDAQVQAWARARYVELLGAGSFANDGSYRPDPTLTGAALQQAIDDWAALTADRAGYVLADEKLAGYAGKALSATDLEAFEDLLAANNSSGINFVLKARTDLDAYAAQAQAALGLATRPTDAQIEAYIEERFEEFAAQTKAALGLPGDPTDAQIETYFEERYQGFVAAIRVKADVDYRALIAAGAIEGGRLVPTTSNVSALAASTLATSEATMFGTLHAARAAATDFALANVDAIYANGKSFRQVAAEALDQDLSGAGNNQRVQEYWTAQYKGLVSAIRNGADAQYRDFNSNRLTARENFSVTNAASNANEGVYAGISSGSVTAGGIAVDAISAVSAKNFASGVGGGVFGAGLGAALAYTESNATVAAYVNGNVTAGAIAANALARDGSGGSAADSRAAAGAGGLKAAIGAAVAVATSANTVTATLGGTVTGTGGTSAALANAMDTTSLWTEAVGATEGGGAAVGASIATSLKSSTVEANIVAASNVGGWGNVMVNSGTAGGLSSKAIAGAGGLGAALNGAVAESRSKEIVNASIGTGATVSAGLVDVVATAIPRLRAESLGISIAGGLAAGASVAESISEAEVKAFTGENVRVIGGGLNIEASALLPRIGTNAEGQPIYGDTAWSKAVAGSGGILVGVNATIAHSISRSEVEAYAGRGLKLPNGTVSILAVNDSRQKSDSTGIAVGFLGIGATEAISSSAGWSKAWLDEDAETQQNRTGAIIVNASGINENRADSTAGAGGVVAGAAALAKTEDKTSTLAELRSGGSNYTIHTTGLSVEARHDTIFKSYADSFQASAVGAAGAEAKNLIDSDVTVQVGEGVVIHSLDSVFIAATTTTTQKGGGARAGSGGVIAGAAAVSDTRVYNDTTVNIGDSTIISLNGDPTTADVKMDIEAFNQLTTGDAVTVDSGGYYAGGGGRSELIATINNTVNIGEDVHLFSVGNLQIGTASINMSNNTANASLYGVVTGAGAKTNSVITVGQNITLGDDVTLEAFGSLNLTAGRSGNGGTASLVSANATTEVYNYALIPITLEYGGRARATNVSNLTMGARNQVLAGRDIVIGAYKGSVSAIGRGTNHNPYLTLFNSTNSSTDSEEVRGANAVLKGTISAGMNNSFAVTIEADGDVVSALPPNWQFTRVNSIAETATSFVSYNDRKLRYAVTGSFNPYADIVTRISTLLNLGEEHVRWRLETRNDIFYGLAPTDEVRRQVETFVNQVYTAGAVPNRTVNSVAIGSMMASAGNVTINADNLTGSVAAVTARGAPGIDILNQSQGYVILNKLLLTTNDGGNIEFTGDDRTEAGITVVEVGSRVTPEVSVRSTWEDPIGSPGYTPDIYFLGSVSALAGNLTVRNESGNVTVLSPNFEAAAINMVVPRGNLSANMGPDSFWEPGGSVISAWRNGQYRPSTAAQAVMAVATYMNPQANFLYDGVTRHDSDPIFSARILVKQYQGKVNDGPSFNGLLSDVWFKVYPDNIGDQASQTNWESEFRSGWYRWQAWNGEGDNSGPFAWMVFDVITRQPLLQERGAAAASAQTPSQQIIGGSILITAETININGTIQSGYSNSWSVDIGDAAASTIAWYKNDAGRRAANAGRLIELPVSALNDAHSKVRAFYDVSNDRIELQHVTKGSGGRVYLNGGIISTSTTGSSQGLIRVNGGYGTVDIRNHTNTALVVNTINTGESSVSTVEIVDHYRGNANGPLRSWYVYDVSNPNAPVSLYQQYGNNTNYNNAQLQWQSAALSGHSYVPAANLVYQWVETANMTRDANIHGMTQLGEWTFVSNLADPYSVVRSVETRGQSTNFRQVVTGSASYYSVSANMSRNNGTDFHGTWQQNVYDRAQIVLTNSVWASFPINIQFLGGANAQVSINSNATVVLNASITNVHGSTSITANGANSAIVTGADGSVTGKSVTLHGQGGIGTADRAVTVQTYGGTLTASSTDRDINISHRGDVNVASIRVNGTGGQDPRGNVKLTATGDIYSSAGYNVANPIIVGKSVELNSIGGAIGARTGVVGGQQVLTNINPIVLQASGVRFANGSIDGGVIDSTSSTGTYLVQSRGDMRIGRVTSNGAVFLAAAGSDGQTANILAGASRTGPSIEEAERLRQVWNSLDLMRQAQQDGTVGADGTPNTNVYAGSAAVHGYQAMVNRAYEDYWLLRAMAFDNEGNYAINSAGKAAMQAQMAEQLEGVDEEDIDALIEAEVRRRYGAARYVLGLSTAAADEEAFKSQLHASQRGSFVAVQAGVILGGLDEYWTEPVVEPVEPGDDEDLPPPPPPRFRYDQTFSYELAADSRLFRDLTSGSRWTIEQLTYTIDAAAAADIPQQSLGERGQNIVAGEVMLYAPRGSIGSLADPRTIVFYSNNPGALSEADRIAISNAGPGEMRLVTEDMGNGVSRYTVTLAQQNLLVASASGSTTVEAQSNIYLGSHANLRLGGISTGLYPGGSLAAAHTNGAQTTAGSVRLEAIGNIVSATAGQAAVTGDIDRLTLISEQGSIGRAGDAGTNPATNDNALILALTGANTGSLNLAQATQGIFLRQTMGDLIVGNITGGAAVQLAAAGSIYALPEFTDRGVRHIVGGSLDLRAGGAIGHKGALYQPLQVAITGAVTGHATGNVSILSPTAAMTIGRAGAYGTLTADGNLVLDAQGGGLTLNRTVSAGGNLSLFASGQLAFANQGDETVEATTVTGNVVVAAGSLLMGAGSRIAAGGLIDIVTAGTATIGQIASTLVSASNATVPLIEIVAGSAGSIRGNGDAVTNLVASATGGMALSAGGAIDLSVSAAWLDAQAGTGDLVVRATREMRSTTLGSTSGAVNVAAAGALNLGSVVSGTATSMTATGGSIAFTTLTAGTSASLDADGDLIGTSLTTGGSATLDASRKIDIATLDIGTALTSTAGTTTKFGLARAGASMAVTSGGLIDIATASAGAGGASLTSTGSSISLGALSAGGSAALDAEDDIEADGIVAAALDAAAGRSIEIADIETTGLAELDAAEGIGGTSLSAGSAKLKAGAGVAFSMIATGGATEIEAGEDILATTFVTGGAATLDAGRKIDIATLDIGTALTSTAVTSTRFNLAEAGASMAVTSGGLIDIATASTGAGDAALTSTGGSILLGTLAAGSAALLDADEDITGTSLTTGGGATFDAGRKIDIATLDVGTVLTSTAAATTRFNLAEAGTSMSVTSGEFIDIATATTGTGNVSMTSTNGLILFGALTAGGAALLDADEDITGISLTTGGAATLDAGRKIDIATLDVGTVLTSTAVTSTRFNLAEAGASMALTSGEFIDIGTATTGSGHAALTSTGGSILFGVLTTGGAANLDADEDITGTSLTTGGAATLDAGRKIDIATLDVGTVLTSTAVTSTRFNLAEAGTSMSVTSGGLIDIATASTGAGDAALTSTGGSILFGALTAGGAVNLNADDDIEASEVTAGAAIAARAGGDIDITEVAAGASVALTAGNGVVAASLTTGDAATVDAGRRIDIVDLDAATSATMVAGQQIAATTVRTGGSASLSAGAGIDISALNAGTTLASTAGTTTRFANATAGESMAVTSGGRMEIATASAGAHASFTSTGSSVALGALTSGGNAELQAAADIEVDDATINGAFGVVAGTAIDVGRAQAAAAIRLAAGTSLTAASMVAGTSASLTAGTAINVDALSAGSMVVMSAGGRIDARDLRAGMAVNASAGSGAAFNSLSAGTDLAIAANGAVAIGNASAGGAAALRSTASDIVLGALASGTDARVEAAGAVNATNLRADGTATVQAGGAIAAGAFAAGIDAVLSAGGTVTGTDVAAGRHLAVTAGLGANLTRAAAGGDFSATAGSDLRIGTATAGGSASASSTAGSLDLGSLSGEAVTLAAAVQVSAGTLLSGGAMKIDAPVVRIGEARSGTGLTVGATSLIDASSLNGDAIDLTTGSAGSVRLGRAEAVRLAIVSGARIEASELALRDSAALAADEIILPSVMHTGTGAPLALDITGRDGAEARRFETFLTTPFGVAFGDYKVADANIGTSGTLVSIARGFASGTLTLRTALRSIFMNNRAATPVPGFDVQLFQPKFAFKLVQDGMKTTSDAFIVNFGEGSEVFFEMNGMVFAGMSMVREFEKAMQGASGGTGGASPFGTGQMARPTATFLASFLAAQTRDSLLVNGGDEDSPAVNLDMTVTNSSQQ
jgi:filamentous hemagglutinin family protein